jgi:hypothetical protein
MGGERARCGTGSDAEDHLRQNAEARRSEAVAEPRGMWAIGWGVRAKKQWNAKARSERSDQGAKGAKMGGERARCWTGSDAEVHQRQNAKARRSEAVAEPSGIWAIG